MEPLSSSASSISVLRLMLRGVHLSLDQSCTGLQLCIILLVGSSMASASKRVVLAPAVLTFDHPSDRLSTARSRESNESADAYMAAHAFGQVKPVHAIGPVSQCQGNVQQIAARKYYTWMFHAHRPPEPTKLRARFSNILLRKTLLNHLEERPYTSTSEQYFMQEVPAL